MMEHLTQHSMQHLINMLEDNHFKQDLILKLNENINIPFINESTEAKIMDALYETVLNAIRESSSG